jgi:hypothetical protein
LGDPGIHTISCSIGNLDINNALCDVGAGVSVMPLTLYHKLNLAECMPTSITLPMADKSTKKPVGVPENILLRLDEHVIPTDFVILDMPEDEKLSIIHGRPFLNTTGAALDCSEGKVTFRICKEEIVKYFPKKPGAKEKYVPAPKRICAVSKENLRPPET